MNKLLAVMEAKRAVGSTAAGQLSETDWEAAVSQAVTVDEAGRLPSDTEWLPSYEPIWTAAVAVDMLALRADLAGGLLKFSSEGAAFEYRQIDLHDTARKLYAQSPLAALATSGHLGFIDVPREGMPYGPRSNSPWIGS